MTKTLQPLPRGGWFILLVDDDPTSLRIMERTLRDTCTICTAAKAEEAVDILQERAPALVILDVMMPDVSGIDVCKMIKTTERLQEVPVIFLSSCDKPGDYGEGYDAGGVMYMAKPVRPAQLLQMVQLYASHIASKGIALCAQHLIRCP
jgi:putative two-component system response regulator